MKPKNVQACGHRTVINQMVLMQDKGVKMTNKVPVTKFHTFESCISYLDLSTEVKTNGFICFNSNWVSLAWIVNQENKINSAARSTMKLFTIIQF